MQPIHADKLIFDYEDLIPFVDTWPKRYSYGRFDEEKNDRIAKIFDASALVKYLIRYRQFNTSSLSTEEGMERFFELLYQSMNPLYFRTVALLLDGRPFVKDWANCRQNEPLVENVIECFLDSLTKILNARVKPYGQTRLEESLQRFRNYLLAKNMYL